MQSVIAAVKYRNHLLVAKDVVIANPKHSLYPKADYQLAFEGATSWLRSSLPESVRHCVRDVRDAPPTSAVRDR